MSELHVLFLIPLQFPSHLSIVVVVHCHLMEFWHHFKKVNPRLLLGDWNAKVGSQETPGVTGKFGVLNEAGQRLIEFCQENTLVMANTLFQQHKRRLYTWTSPDGQHRSQIDYILCSQRWRSSIQSAKTRLGDDWLGSWTPYCQIQTEIEERGEDH